MIVSETEIAPKTFLGTNVVHLGPRRESLDA